MLNSIQTLRALAAWLVVLHHYMQIAHNFKLTDTVSIALFKYGAIGVDLFFVISGFVIYLSASGKNQTPMVFALHRIVRIAPAYWLFTLITAALLIFAPGIVPLTLYDPIFLIKSLFFIPAQNPSGIGLFPIITVGWTLNYEMAFYAIFFFTLFAPAKFRIPAIVLGVFLLGKAIPELGGDFVFFTNKIVYEFLFGIFIAYAYQKGIIQKIPTTLAALMTAIALWKITDYGPVNHDPFRSGLPCAVILIAAVSQERHFSRIGFLRQLGDWSYSTYLCHVLVMCLLIQVQLAFNLSDWMTFALIVLGIGAVSYASFTFIERPLSRLTKQKMKGALPASTSA
ncbi:acyltransferase [Pseudomonas sp. ICBG1301]|uniref:acyltransferase family protein n=1 Tax=Pseudomonas sp. ICBG1301 TaxID=2795987 RepID=UPI001964D552|nr:acyltransferase [Pseudomonas sp. ICBG1301]MBM9485588.1 acyltransferase [Pseudomonas sp. ICBG1301]